MTMVGRIEMPDDDDVRSVDVALEARVARLERQLDQLLALFEVIGGTLADRARSLVADAIADR